MDRRYVATKFQVLALLIAFLIWRIVSNYESQEPVTVLFHFKNIFGPMQNAAAFTLFFLLFGVLGLYRETRRSEHIFSIEFLYAISKCIFYELSLIYCFMLVTMVIDVDSNHALFGGIHSKSDYVKFTLVHTPLALLNQFTKFDSPIDYDRHYFLYTLSLDAFGWISGGWPAAYLVVLGLKRPLFQNLRRLNANAD